MANRVEFAPLHVSIMDIGEEEQSAATGIKQDENDNTTSAQSNVDVGPIKKPSCTNGLKMECSADKEVIGEGLQINDSSCGDCTPQEVSEGHPEAITDDIKVMDVSKDNIEVTVAGDCGEDETYSDTDLDNSVEVPEAQIMIQVNNGEHNVTNAPVVDVTAGHDSDTNRETTFLMGCTIDSSNPDQNIPGDLQDKNIPGDLPDQNIPGDLPDQSIPGDLPDQSIPSYLQNQNERGELQRSPSPEDIIVMEGIFEPRPSTSRDSGINRLGSPVSGSGSIDHTEPDLDTAPVRPSIQDPVPARPPIQDPVPARPPIQDPVPARPPIQDPVPARPPLTVSLSASAQDRRQRLKFLPRTSQYEKNPLLQIRSDSGMSEFELLLLERDTRHSESVETKLRTFSLDESGRTHTHQRPGPRRLEPRGAHMEKNALFEKNASGLYELEQYLLEKEQELGESSSTSQEVSCASVQSAHSITSVPVTTSSTTTAESGFGTLSESSNLSIHTTSELSSFTQPTSTSVDEITLVDVKPRRPPMQHSKSISEGSLPSRRMTLQPRRIQYEKSSLLETRDDSGLSEIDRFLREKETEIQEKGKCSTKCTCKNVNCVKCKGSSPRLLSKEIDMLTRIEPKMNNKRVHFQRQDCVQLSPERHKTDDEEDGDSPQSNTQGGAPPSPGITPEGTQTQDVPEVQAVVTETPPLIEQLTIQTPPAHDQLQTEPDNSVKGKAKTSSRKHKRRKSTCTML